MPTAVPVTRSRSARAPVLALTAALMLSACSSSEEATLTGVIRTPPPNVGAVELPDVAGGGTLYPTRASSGHLLIVYFGYTACPDICPTTMADLRRAVRNLEGGGDLIEVAMITVDPERDVPERLTAYVQNFFAGGHALRTEDPAALRRAATAFGADYDVTTDESGLIEVSHSAFLYAVDDRGRIVVQWPFGTPSSDIQNDLALLIEQGV